jgi:hypothetical protein
LETKLKLDPPLPDYHDISSDDKGPNLLRVNLHIHTDLARASDEPAVVYSKLS